MQTRERILHAALRLFSEKGFSFVSVSDIADEAGIKTPSPYKHFRSEEDIFDSCTALLAERMQAERSRLGVPGGGRPAFLCESVTEEQLRARRFCFALVYSGRRRSDPAFVGHAMRGTTGQVPGMCAGAGLSPQRLFYAPPGPGHRTAPGHGSGNNIEIGCGHVAAYSLTTCWSTLSVTLAAIAGNRPNSSERGLLTGTCACAMLCTGMQRNTGWPAREYHICPMVHKIPHIN